MKPIRPPSATRHVWWIAASLLLVTVGHYSTPTQHAGVHDLLRRLYYLPIILAGVRYGVRGGLVTAGAAAIIYLPHLFMQWGGARPDNLEKFLELVLFGVVGTITGVLADRLRAAVDGQRRAHESLRKQSAQLLGAQELAELGARSSELAHEIKNPLASVKVAAELFQERLRPEDPLCEFATILCKETDRLERVVEGCLAPAWRPDSKGTLEQPPAGVETVEDVATEERHGRHLVELPVEGASLDEVVRDAIIQSLARAGWNRSKAARLLRVPRHILLYRMQKLGIGQPEAAPVPLPLPDDGD